MLLSDRDTIEVGGEAGIKIEYMEKWYLEEGTETIIGLPGGGNKNGKA